MSNMRRRRAGELLARLTALAVLFGCLLLLSSLAGQTMAQGAPAMAQGAAAPAQAGMPSVASTATPAAQWSGRLVIAHFTDAHIGQQWLCGQRLLNQVVPEVNASGADVAVDTGDCTDHSYSSEWAQYNSIVAGLTLPWEVIPGNHDSTYPVDVYGSERWSWDVGRYRLLGLGCCGEPYWPWVDRKLATGRPTIIFRHYPLGEQWYDWKLKQRMRQYNVVAFVSGHWHYDAQWTCAGGAQCITTARACMGSWTLITIQGQQVTVERH